MTREEAYNRIDAIIARHEIDDVYVTITNYKDYDALRMAREILEQEPCVDAVSRQALIERINNAEENFKADHMESIASDDGDAFVDGVLSGVFNIREMVAQAPSVTPTRKKGKWIVEVWNNKEHHTCSICQHIIDKEPCYHYCPYCGAEMKSEQLLNYADQDTMMSAT